MLNIEQIKEHLKKGHATKYDEEKHIALLVGILSEGRSVAAFCAEALIDKRTFYNWKKAHPKFKYAYEVAINLAEVKWEEMPFVTPSSEFNYQHWALTMRNRFGFGKPVIDLTEEKTPQGRSEIILKGLAEGALTIDEAAKLANLIGVQAGITQGDAAIEITKASREEKLKLLAIYDKGIEDLRRENGNMDDQAANYQEEEKEKAA